MQARRALLYMPGDNRHISSNEGRYTFAVDGRMIDMPLVKAARNVLARARTVGKN